MYEYRITCNHKSIVTLEVLNHERKFKDNCLTLSKKWHELFDTLLQREYIGKYYCKVKTEDNVPMVFGHTEIWFGVNSKGGRFIHDFDIHRPPVYVESKLDWLTLIGFIKLYNRNKLKPYRQAISKMKESYKPKSKKETLKDWSYQS